LENVVKDATSKVVVYPTFGDFVERAKKKAPRANLSSRDEPAVWAGGTFEEAITLATEGWQAPVKQTEHRARNAAQSVIAQREDYGFTTVLDVTGETLDLGRYCADEPECLYEPVLTSEVRHGRVVPILVTISASCSVDESQIRARGAAVAALANVLRQAGFTLDVWVAEAVRGRGVGDVRRHCSLVHVQPANAPLDMGRLLYATGHPTMLRRLVFSVQEDEPTEVRAGFGFTPGGGYGMPTDAVIEDLHHAPGVRVDQAIVLPQTHYAEDWTIDENVERWIGETVGRIQNGEKPRTLAEMLRDGRG
jgi:hypothetical protein